MLRAKWFALLAISVASYGCGNQSAETSQSVADPAATASNNDLAAKTATPDSTVSTFLNSVKSGDDAGAAALLTELARTKTQEMDMAVAPPGSDTATFEVGQVEMVGDDQAHVASNWSDVDHQGATRTDQITWILRKESAGWRIAGMAAQIFPDQDPVVLNFEDPAGMIAKQQEVAAEESRRQQEAENQGAQQQARQPEDPFQSRQ